MSAARPIPMRHLRQYLCAALASVGASASAQLIPWSEPPALAHAGVPPTPRPAPEPRRVVAPKKSPAIETALAVLPSSLDGPAIFRAFVGPSSILLSSFSTAPNSGGVLTGTSWVGQVTQNTGSITVAGTAVNDNGWGARGLSLDTTGMNFLTITAQRDTGNLAPTLFFQFEDQSLRTRVLSVSTSLFAMGTPTVVQIPLQSWTIDFGSSSIAGWSIGGGGVSSSDTAAPFRLTFDEVSFSASAIPEPGTYAILAGLAALGVVAYRRRGSRV